MFEVYLILEMDPNGPTLRRGGIVNYVNLLIKFLSEKRIRTTLLGFKVFETHARTNSYHEFVPICKSTRFSIIFFLFLFLKAPFLRVPKNAIIQAHNPLGILPFALFYPKNPKICSLRGKTTETVRLLYGTIVASLFNLLEGTALRFANLCASVDETTKDYFIQKYPFLKGRIEVIGGGVDLDKFKPLDKKRLRREYEYDEDEKILLYVGRLEVEKNLAFLIRAFERVKTKRPCRLLLVGQGREREKLEKFVKENGISDVDFLGPIYHDKIPEIMNCADVVCLSSFFEGSPNVVKESLACGVPVVATNVGDVAKIIQNDKVGRIVAKGCEGEFAEAIIQILEDENRALTREACRSAARQLSFQLVGLRTLETYNRVLRITGNT